jgi:O-acetyl-ADP-ribose deacetylase
VNTVIHQYRFASDRLLQLIHGDLTEENVDAIVNAANAYLQHGGGVAGAISRRGGAQIQAESDAWVRMNGLAAPEHPACTSAGKLPCHYVIHAVGPVWGEGGEDAKLAAAVRSSLQLAGEMNLASLSLPAISTGIFGFPKERAARIILATIAEYFTAQPATSLHQCRLVINDQATLDVFDQAFVSAFPRPA